MKTNTMMRVASVLLVAVLLSTCVISGTFAKYVTSDDATDSARVAKWGVGITTSGTLFGEQYKDAPIADANDNTITVQVNNYADSTTNNVVAPGTKNETGLTFTLTGTPEVDVAIKIEIESSDIFLPAGTYGTTDTTGYNPVVFTLKNGAGATLVQGTLATIATWLEGLSKTYDSNTNLATIGTGADTVTKTDGTYVLTWEWDFDDNGSGTNDDLDTALGNILAGQSVPGAITETSFNITISATQVN